MNGATPLHRCAPWHLLLRGVFNTDFVVRPRELALMAAIADVHRWRERLVVLLVQFGCSRNSAEAVR